MFRCLVGKAPPTKIIGGGPAAMAASTMVLQPESEPGQEKVSRTLRRRVVQTTADSLQKLTLYFDPDDSLDPVTIAQENGRLKGTPPNPSESGDIRDLKNRKKKRFKKCLKTYLLTETY